MNHSDTNTKLHRLKNILKSRHFRSSFSLLFVLLCIICAGGGIFLTFQNLERKRVALEERASYAASDVHSFLSGMQNSAVFIGNLTSIHSLLASPAPTIDQFSRMINDVTPYSSIYSCESICIYLNRSERIFDTSGGMYYFSDFYDRRLLEELQTQTREELWLFNIPYQRYYGPKPAVPVIMYARRLPLFTSEKQGYITVSYSLDRFQSIAEEAVSPSGYTACMTFRDQLLWSNSDSVSQNWDTALSISENEAVLFENTTSYSSLPIGGVQCTFYVSNAELVQDVLPSLLRWLSGCLAAVAAVFTASMIYSALMLQHVDAMMRKIGIIPYTENSSNDRDEFFRMNSALDSLNTRMSNIESIMRENQQLVQERLLSGILYNRVNPNVLPQEYQEHGLTFPYPYYTIILIFLPTLDKTEDFTRREQLRLLVKTNAQNAFSVLGSAHSLYTDNGSICIILNTSLFDRLQEELSKICIILKEHMKQNLSLYPQFSIGICTQTEPHPWQAYQIARRNFIFTAADSDDFVLFGFQNEFTSAIDPDLLFLLSQAIIDKDQIRLKELADLFCSRYLAGTELSEYRRLSVIALCALYSSILDVNGRLQDSQFSTYLRRLETSSTIPECEKNFYSCLFGLQNAKSKMSLESHGYIQKAIQYLEQHYQQAITIPQIADYVGVSPIYLNKLFKLSTGKTLSEYLNYYRNQCSIPLLLDSRNTINDISASIGYADVRSYIRFFKKFYHMTPGEYRREYGQKSGSVPG